jgi:hypothetical protein
MWWKTLEMFVTGRKRSQSSYLMMTNLALMAMTMTMMALEASFWTRYLSLTLYRTLIMPVNRAQKQSFHSPILLSDLRKRIVPGLGQQIIGCGIEKTPFKLPRS